MKSERWKRIDTVIKELEILHEIVHAFSIFVCKHELFLVVSRNLEVEKVAAHLGLAEYLLVVLVPGGCEGQPAVRGVGAFRLEADLTGGLGGEGQAAVEPGDDGGGAGPRHLATQGRHRPLRHRFFPT